MLIGMALNFRHVTEPKLGFATFLAYSDIIKMKPVFILFGLEMLDRF